MMFGRKQRDEEERDREEESRDERCAKADSLVRETLAELNRGLAVKREVREKTARFVGSLRPLVKAR